MFGLAKAISVECGALVSSRKVEVVGSDTVVQYRLSPWSTAFTLWHVWQSRFGALRGSSTYRTVLVAARYFPVLQSQVSRGQPAGLIGSWCVCTLHPARYMHGCTLHGAEVHLRAPSPSPFFTRPLQYGVHCCMGDRYVRPCTKTDRRLAACPRTTCCLIRIHYFSLEHGPAPRALIGDVLLRPLAFSFATARSLAIFSLATCNFSCSIASLSAACLFLELISAILV